MDKTQIIKSCNWSCQTIFIANTFSMPSIVSLDHKIMSLPFTGGMLCGEKLIPTDISLQMADKSTAVAIGICEDVPVQVTNNCLILTDFVVLDMLI